MLRYMCKLIVSKLLICLQLNDLSAQCFSMVWYGFFKFHNFQVTFVCVLCVQHLSTEESEVWV